MSLNISHNLSFTHGYDSDTDMYSEMGSLSGVALSGGKMTLSDIDISVSLHESSVALADSVSLAVVTSDRDLVKDLPSLLAEGGSLYVPDGAGRTAYVADPSNLGGAEITRLLIDYPKRWGWAGVSSPDWSSRSMRRLISLPGVNLEWVFSLGDSSQPRIEVTLSQSWGYLFFIPFVSYMAEGDVIATARLTAVLGAVDGSED